MTYEKMFEKVNRGEISEKVWKKYCRKILFELIEENKEVFIRLKNN